MSSTVATSPSGRGSANTRRERAADPSYDHPVTLDTFHILMGIPLDHDRNRNDKNEGQQPGQNPIRVEPPSPFPRWMRHKQEDPEAQTSIYYSILDEESKSIRKVRFYNWLTYSALVLQLIVSSVIIVLGALPEKFRVPITVLGALNGVVTGILSLVRGQGLPNRFQQYADGLRRVREDIEWMDRELRAGNRTVKYGDVVKLREDYEDCRGDEIRNQPDTWNSVLPAEAAKPKTQGTQGAA